MPQFVNPTNILSTRVRISNEHQEIFVFWQSKLNDMLVLFPGFISLEILSSEHSQESKSWTFVQRFLTPQSAFQWKEFDQRLALINELKNMSLDGIVEESVEEKSLTSGVTEVLITQVDQQKEAAYRKWLAKIHQAEARFEGFKGMYLQSPTRVGDSHWITLLQFDSAEHLDHWLSSKEREEILKELDPMINSLESHRIISPYAGWLGSIVKVGEIPAVWKQTMLVLLVLFPIVMFELKFLSPFTKEWGLTLSTFIGNAISVTLISWPGMPIAIWMFKWWLLPSGKKPLFVNVLGCFLLFLFYLLEIILLNGI